MTSISVYVQLQTKTEYMHKSHKVKIRETADRTDEWRERERTQYEWRVKLVTNRQTHEVGNRQGDGKR